MEISELELTAFDRLAMKDKKKKRNWLAFRF